jgi:predicted amidohydrolase YtcJ
MRGSISVGKYADLVVLSQDPFEGAPESLLKTHVKMTLFGGKVVYDAEKQ